MTVPGAAVSGGYHLPSEASHQPGSAGCVSDGPRTATSWHAARSAARQRLHDGDLVARCQHRRQIAHRFVVHEHLHVLANVALLVDHAELNSRKLTIKIGEQLGERR